MNVLLHTFAFFLLISFSSKAQSDFIVYDLPESVTNKVKEYIDGYRLKDNNKQFSGYLFNNKGNHYVLGIMIHDIQSIDTLDLIQEKIIKKTNRMIRAKEDYLIPLMIHEDLIFADLGHTKQKNGKVVRKKVIYNFDGYIITFNKSGKIYK